MHRRRNPTQGFLPRGYFPAQAPQHYLQVPYAVAPLNPGCLLPQNYMPQLPYRLPYPTYTLVTYPSLPTSSLDYYRLLGPAASLVPPTGYPYQISYGNQVLRPTWVTQAAAHNQCDNPVHPRMRMPGQATAQQYAPNEFPATNGATAPDANCAQHSCRKKRPRQTTKRKGNKSVDSSPMQGSQRCCNASRTGARFQTSFRQQAKRKRRLNTRTSLGSRPSSSFATDISSIQNPNGAVDDDDDYQTCNEEENEFNENEKHRDLNNRSENSQERNQCHIQCSLQQAANPGRRGRMFDNEEKLLSLAESQAYKTSQVNQSHRPEKLESLRKKNRGSLCPATFSSAFTATGTKSDNVQHPFCGNKHFSANSNRNYQMPSFQRNGEVSPHASQQHRAIQNGSKDLEINSSRNVVASRRSNTVTTNASSAYQPFTAAEHCQYCHECAESSAKLRTRGSGSGPTAGQKSTSNWWVAYVSNDQVSEGELLPVVTKSSSLHCDTGALRSNASKQTLEVPIHQDGDVDLMWWDNSTDIRTPLQSPIIPKKKIKDDHENGHLSMISKNSNESGTPSLGSSSSADANNLYLREAQDFAVVDTAFESRGKQESDKPDNNNNSLTRMNAEESLLEKKDPDFLNLNKQVSNIQKGHIQGNSTPGLLDVDPNLHGNMISTKSLPQSCTDDKLSQFYGIITSAGAQIPHTNISARKIDDEDDAIVYAIPHCPVNLDTSDFVSPAIDEDYCTQALTSQKKSRNCIKGLQLPLQQNYKLRESETRSCVNVTSGSWTCSNATSIQVPTFIHTNSVPSGYKRSLNVPVTTVCSRETLAKGDAFAYAGIEHTCLKTSLPPQVLGELATQTFPYVPGNNGESCQTGSLLNMNIDCSRFNAPKEKRPPTPHSIIFQNSPFVKTDNDKTYTLTPASSTLEMITADAGKLLTDNKDYSEAKTTKPPSQKRRPCNKGRKQTGRKTSVKAMQSSVVKGQSASEAKEKPQNPALVKKLNHTQLSSSRLPKPIRCTSQRKCKDFNKSDKPHSTVMTPKPSVSEAVNSVTLNKLSTASQRKISSDQVSKNSDVLIGSPGTIHLAKTVTSSAKQCSNSQEPIFTNLRSSLFPISSDLSSASENTDHFVAASDPPSLALKETTLEGEIASEIPTADQMPATFPTASQENYSAAKYSEKIVTKPTFSSAAVSSRAPPRRSPRVPRSNSLAQSPSMKNESKSTALCSIVRNPNDNRWSQLQDTNRRDAVPSDNIATHSKSIQQAADSTDAYLTDELPSFHRNIIHSDIFQASVFFTSAAPTPASSPAVMSRSVKTSVETVTHGRIHSSIKSIVHNLLSRSVRPHINSNFSPCLTALQTGWRRKQPEMLSGLTTTSQSPGIHCARKIRSNSAPPTPRLNSSQQESRISRSASLSDVFYDSTVDGSAAFDSSIFSRRKESSRSRGSKSIFSELQMLSQSAKKRTCLMKSRRSLAASTYISFSPPTLTPPQQNVDAEKTAASPVPLRSQTTNVFADPLSTRLNKKKSSDVMLMRSYSPEYDNVLDLPEGESLSEEVPVRQVLDGSLEREVRKSAEMLLDSVVEMAEDLFLPPDSLQNEYCNVYEDIDEKLKGEVLEDSLHLQDDTRKSSTHAQEDNSVIADSLDVSKQPDTEKEQKTSDRSTQTPDRLTNSEETKKEETSAPRAKLSVPPKKPPRNITPNSCTNDEVKRVVQEAQEKTRGNDDQIKGFKKEVDSPTLFPNLTLFATAVPGQSKYGSPTLVTLSLAQQFFRGTLLPAGVWKSDTAPRQASREILHDVSCSLTSTETELEESKDKCSSRESSSRAQMPEITIPIEKISDKSCSGLSTIKWKAPSTSSLFRPTHLYLLAPSYPTRPHPLRSTAPKHPPMLRRRRSFSGITSSSVEKTRLNRRYMHYLTRRPYPSKVVKQNYELNYSHPTAKKLERRPRFIRSSLTDDTVYESVKENSNVFITKPAFRKNSAPNITSISDALQESVSVDSSHVEDKKSHSLPVPMEVDIREEPIIRRTEKLEPIPEQEHDKEEKTEFKDNCSEATSSANATTVNKDTKKPQKMSTLQRLKKIMSSKKVAKRAGEYSQSANRSKTDSKLPQKEGTPGLAGRDHILEKFRKSRKMFAESEEESTLKGETNVNTPSTLRKVTLNTEEKNKQKQSSQQDSILLKDDLVKATYHVVGMGTNAYSNHENKDEGNEDDVTTELADFTTESIRRNSDQCSASTPGMRINSETGDVIEEDRKGGDDPGSGKRMHKLLSSTAIDEDNFSVERALNFPRSNSIDAAQ